MGESLSKQMDAELVNLDKLLTDCLHKNGNEDQNILFS